MTRLVKRAWVPLVMVIVVAVAAFTVSRLHGVFGSHMYRPDAGNADAIVQFNPKRVLYEIFGPAGTVADINYLDAETEPMRTRPVSRAVIAVLTGAFAATTCPSVAAADATDDYPIPHRIIATTCTAEQILAAARDFAPIYYERYMIDKHNKSPEVQQAAIDNAHYFFSLSPQDRRAYSEQMATNLPIP